MKPFDLEAAKRGAAVCTRDGREARILCFDAIGYSNGRIIALVKSENNTLESCFSYNDIGIAKYNENNLDLILKMRDDDYLERLDRGGYGRSVVKQNLITETPTCKESLPVVLTKREWFAGLALAGEIAGFFAGDCCVKREGKNAPKAIAEDAVLFADALIAELEKKN